MRIKHLLVLPGALLLVVLATLLSGQTKRPTDEQIKSSYEAHKGDFDYLVGDWEFTAQSKDWGKHHGFWSAVRLEGGQVLDEYRVVGDNGETYTTTLTLRVYNAVRDQWELISFQQSTGLQDFGAAHREGHDMLLEQTFGAMSNKPSQWHIRYHDIQPDRFLWNGDCSGDGGKTWVKDCLQIEAHRIGNPRQLDPLAPSKKPAAAKPAR